MFTLFDQFESPTEKYSIQENFKVLAIETVNETTYVCIFHDLLVENFRKNTTDFKIRTLVVNCHTKREQLVRTNTTIIEWEKYTQYTLMHKEDLLEPSE